MNNFKNMRDYPYILCYEMEVASLFNTWLVSDCEEKLLRLYSSWTKAVRNAKSAATKNGFNVTFYQVV